MNLLLRVLNDLQSDDDKFDLHNAKDTQTLIPAAISELEAITHRLRMATNFFEESNITEVTATHLARKLTLARAEVIEILDKESLPMVPTLDILLDLFVNGQAGLSVTISDAASAGICPPTTGLRWVHSMIGAKIIRRIDDAADSRRVFVALSPRGKSLALDIIKVYSSLQSNQA